MSCELCKHPETDGGYKLERSRERKISKKHYELKIYSFVPSSFFLQSRNYVLSKYSKESTEDFKFSVGPASPPGYTRPPRPHSDPRVHPAYLASLPGPPVGPASLPALGQEDFLFLLSSVGLH